MVIRASQLRGDEWVATLRGPFYVAEVTKTGATYIECRGYLKEEGPRHPDYRTWFLNDRLDLLCTGSAPPRSGPSLK